MKRPHRPVPPDPGPESCKTPEPTQEIIAEALRAIKEGGEKWTSSS